MVKLEEMRAFSMFELLRHHVFRRLYGAHVIHLLGNEFTFIAVLGLLKELSGSGLSFAAGTVFRFLPYVLASFFAGPLLEKWDKRRVMIVCNLMRGILVSLFFWITDASFLWAIFLLLTLVNICSAFFSPAMQVVIVQSVEPESRLSANSLITATNSFMMIIGQGIAAYLVYAFSFRFNFLLDAGCYFLSLLFLLRLPSILTTNLSGEIGFFGRLLEGFRYVKGNKPIMKVLFLQMMERATAAYYTLLMYFILEERGQPLYLFGLLDIPMGIGGVLAGILVNKWAERLDAGRVDTIMAGALCLIGCSVWLMFHSGHVAVWMATTFFLSIGSFSLMILTVTRLQRLADPAFLARVFSVREMLTMGVFALGCLLVGWGTEWVNSAMISNFLAGWGILAGIIWLVIRKSAERSM